MGDVVDFRPRAKTGDVSKASGEAVITNRGNYLAIDRVLKSLAGQGTKECRTITRKADGWLSVDLGDPEANAATRHFRVALRVRCGLCPKRCKKALSPKM